MVINDFFLVLMCSVVANGRFLAYMERRGSLSASLRLCVSALNRRNAKAQRRKGAKELIRGERAQLQTLEGFAAALLMVGTVYLAVTAVTLSVPQTELHIDAQLKTYGRDALAILDAQIPPEDEGEYYTSSLKNSVVGWMNGAEGATNWETEEFEPSNSGTNQTSYRFKFREPFGCTYNHTFNVSIPNNTRISHAYLTLTGMPRLDDTCPNTETIYKLDDPNGSSTDRFGCSIAHGDVNDDGVSDLIVGAYANNSSSGAVYIYYGNESGISSWKDDGPNVTITNPGESGDCFGWAVACGDVNNDTVDDVIVGAPNNDTDNDGNDIGVVYAYYGGSTPSTHPNATIFNPRGATPLGEFGYSLACGDVNGDNDTDLLIGAPTVDCDGNAFVYYGNISGDYGYLNHSVRLHGSSNEFFGISVACVDINKDGMSDIVIGANATNVTYIRFGSTSLPTPIDASKDTEINLTLSGKSGSGFGFSVSSAGDVNKDGVDDLVVGAPGNDAAHIFYGGDSDNPPDNTSDINLTGPSGCGISVSAAGDVDSDGYAGVIVGTSSDSAGVFYDLDLGVGAITVSETDAGFGTVVSHISDVNNDTIPDIAVGAPDAGKVYVYTPRFPEAPWLAVGDTTDLANGNGTKVWEYTTVIKTDNGIRTDEHTFAPGAIINKTLPIYREIATDVNLSMRVKTSVSTDVSISVNGVAVADALNISTGGTWKWYNDTTLLGDITEWKIGNNSIVINVTSGALTVGDVGNGTWMIRIILPIAQPFKTTERTSDFAAAINDWMDAHPLNGNLSDTGNTSSYQWHDPATNETGWNVTLTLHSNSSGAIDVTNLRVKATASLEENLYTLLPNFIEYNVVFAYLKMITKGHVYTFSDDTYSNTSTFDDDGGDINLSVILPRNTTEVYIAKMIVSGSANGTSTAERVSTSTEWQSDPCIAVNNSSAMLVWTDGTSPTSADQRIYSAVRGISAGPWSSAVQVNASSNPQQRGTLGMNNTGAFVAWVEGATASRRIRYDENGTGIGVNASSDIQTEPSIAANSTGHAFIAWTENGSVRYSEYNRTAWSPSEQVNFSTHPQTEPALAVNDSGWAFVMWVEQDKIRYSEYNRTTWLNATDVSTAADQSSPTIAANDSGWVFAAGVHGTGASAQVYYSYYNRTNWSNPAPVNDTLGGQTKPDIAIDSSNHAHVVWEQLGKIYYSNNTTGGGWGAAVRITDDGTNPTIAVDSSDVPHIAWEHDNKIWYVKGAVETSYYGNYPTLPYVLVNGSNVWEYNITESNYNDTSTEHSMTLCNGSSLSKTFNIDETVEGPVTLSICAGGNDSSFDLYVNGEYANSGYTTPNTEHQNITTSRDLWRRNDNEVRINVTSGCASWNYTNSIGDSNDWYYNQSNRTNLYTNNTWMIRLYGHEYRGTQMIGNPNTRSKFSAALDGCLNPNATSDQEINFTIHSTKGNLTLHTLRIYYYIRGNKTEVAQTRVITHNVPPSDTVTVTRLVTIHDSDRPDEKEAEKRIPDTGVNPNIPIANMVEVRLELWYR